MARFIQMLASARNPGIAAERFIHEKILQPSGFALKKLQGPRVGRRPEGYIVDSKKKKIAVVEVKYLGDFDHELHDRNVVEDIKKAIIKAKISGGGLYWIRVRKALPKQEVTRFRSTIKQSLSLLNFPASQNEIYLDIGQIQLHFSRLSRHRKWKWGGGSGPGRSITPYTKVHSAINKAKEQFKQQVLDHTLPKVLCLFIDSGEINFIDFIDGIIGVTVFVVPIGGEKSFSIPEGYHNKPLRNEFVSGQLSGVVAVIPWGDVGTHHLWVAENKFCRHNFPRMIYGNSTIDGYIEVSQNGVRDLLADRENKKAPQNAGEVTT